MFNSYISVYILSTNAFLMNSKLLALITIIATFGLLGAIVPATMSAYAFHNDHGHSDKASVGDCKRFTDKADFCQDKESKDLFQEQRKS